MSHASKTGTLLGAGTGHASKTGTAAKDLTPSGHSYDGQSVFLFLGQSNDNGQGDTSKADPGLTIAAVYANVRMNEWIGTADSDPIPTIQTGTESLQPYAPPGVPGMGAELSFGRHVYETHVSKKPYVAKFGVSGSPIEQWLPGSGFPSGTELYTLLTTFIDARLAEAGAAKPAAFLWIHGESAATSDALANVYLTRLDTFFGDLWAKYGSDVPVGIVQLNANMTGGGIIPSARATVRAAQASFVAANPTRAFLIPVDDLPLNADSLHYPSDSYIVIGNRAAEQGAAFVAPARVSDTGEGAAPWIQRQNMPVVTSTGAAMTPYLPAHQAGDIIVVVAMNSIANSAPVLTTANGFSLLGTSVSHTGTTYCTLAVYTKVAASPNETAPVITPGAGSAQALCVAFTVRNSSGVDASAAGGNNAFVSGAFTVAGVTTTQDNDLVLYLLGVHGGNSTNKTSGWANATLAGFANVRDTIKAVGSNDPLIEIAAGTLAAPGPSGNATGSFSQNALWASMAIAFKP